VSGEGVLVGNVQRFPPKRRARLATPYLWRDPASIPPREFIYGRELIRGEVSGTIAPGAAAKTILSVGRALSMATGRPLLGKPIWGGPKRVWIWNLEDPKDELDRIIQAACKHWGLTKADVGDRLLVDTALEGKELKLARSTASGGLTLNRDTIEALIDELAEYEIDHLHIDPFVSAHGADESDNGEIDTIAKELVKAAVRGRAAISFAHHTSKSGAGDVTAMSSRGAVALINACRTVLTINRMTEEEARRYGIEDETRRRYFRLYDDKPNRAPPAGAADWFRLISVDLGNSTDDRPADSVGVVVPWSPPDPFEGLSDDHLYQVQLAIAEGSYRADSQADDWAGNIVADIVGADLSAPADKGRVKSLLKTWVKNGALVESSEKHPGQRREKKFVRVGRWVEQ